MKENIGLGMRVMSVCFGEVGGKIVSNYNYDYGMSNLSKVL